MQVLVARTRWAAPVGAVTVVTLWVVFIVTDALVPVETLGRPMWQYLFDERGPVEHLQWATLAIAAFIAISAAAVLERSDDERTSFFRWIGAGFLLLLIEDAGNTSHAVRGLLAIVFPDAHYGLIRLPVFLVLGAVMLVALVKGWRTITAERRTRQAFLLGYGLYATAAAMSVPLQLLGVYDRIGHAIVTGPLGRLIVSLPEPIWGATEDREASPARSSHVTEASDTT